MTDNNDILLSIIIPVYNSEVYLRQCVDSILEQVSDDIEIILVDDGSTDLSGQICDAYSRDNPQIKTVHQKNSGVASARNRGIQESRGRYLFFVDNDDWINKGKLQNLLEIIKQNKSDVVIHKYIIQKGNGASVGNDVVDKSRIDDRSAEEVLTYLRKERINITAPWEYVVKKQIIIRNNLSFNSNQAGVDDSSFTPILFCNCESFYLNKDTVYSWRVRKDSQGSTHNHKEFIRKMISTIGTLSEYARTVQKKYKKDYLLFRIYKNIYSLVGPYYTYSQDDRPAVKAWLRENSKIVEESVRQSGFAHKVLIFVFGNFYGILLSYRLALLKGKTYLWMQSKN